MEGLAALAEERRLSPAEVMAELALRERGAVGNRPRVAAVMIASIDGQATVAGRSRGLGHPLDRALMRSLRASADAVLVGAATVRAERYARLFDAEDVAARVAAGLPERPPLVVATRSGDVPWDVGVFSEAQSSVVVASGTVVEVPADAAATVELLYEADLGAMLEHLAQARGTRLVVCEGGPRLLAALTAAGLLDDLILTVAPLVVGGAGPVLLTGPALEPPARLALAGAWRADDHLFLHYTA